MSRCSICGRRVWLWQRQGWSFRRERATRWHTRCVLRWTAPDNSSNALGVEVQYDPRPQQIVEETRR